MNNLVIIGNGFDLAHGLKTSYSDFIKYIVDSHCKDSNLYNDLFLYTQQKFGYMQLLDIIKNRSGHAHGITWKNDFFRKMVMNVAHSNWCDIEKLYFSELTKKEQNKDPKFLNNEFEVIKSYLEDYLELEKDKFNPIQSYTSLFSHLNNASKTFILNFNYTDTVKKYKNGDSKLDIVNIHGELKSKSNPMIFGFAADDNQSRELIGKED